jgi:hypothetical protein
VARNAILQIRHDTQENWEASTLILVEGEFAYATDTRVLKLGDGFLTWYELPSLTSIPAGGATDNVLVKSSDDDYDVIWTSNLFIDSIRLNTEADIAVSTPGEMAWDAEAGAIDIQLNDGVTQHLGQEMYYRVKADEAISKGDLVMAVGTVGNSGIILVGKASPTYGEFSDIASQRLMGLAASDIADGDEGYIVHFGKLRQLDTEQWLEGSILYADPATPGGLTDTQPDAPNWKTIIALVITSHQNVGELFIRPTFGSQLNNDEAVTLTDPVDGHVLAYQSGVWKNKPMHITTNYVLATQVFK